MHLTLLLDVALPESAIEASFKAQKAQVAHLPMLEGTISKQGNEKDRMLMILTYDFE